jgi:hypothetical protein
MDPLTDLWAAQFHAQWTQRRRPVSVREFERPNFTSANSGARYRLMAGQENHHKSKDFDDFACGAPLQAVFTGEKSRGPSRRNSLKMQRVADLLNRTSVMRAWYTFATLFAVLAACVSITSPVRSQTQIVWSLSQAVEIHAAEDRATQDSATGSPSDAAVARNTHPSHLSQDHQALESECDDRDVDFEAAPIGSFSLADIPALRSQQQAQYTGSVIAAAHLRTSSDFPRGPPLHS